MNVTEWWELQDSGRKKGIVIVGGLIALMAVLWMLPGRAPTERAEVVSDVQVDILGDDRGQADLQTALSQVRAMQDQIGAMERNNQALQRRMQGFQNALSAATAITENPEQLGELVDQVNRLNQDFQDLRENGSLGSGQTSTAPPVLVLGGDGNQGGNGQPQSNAQPNLSNPFSDAPDAQGGPIAAYDPLARIRGAITDGAQNDPGTGSDRFGFMRDSNFERPPPRIVIDEPAAMASRQVRTAGTRPNQISRDRQTELIDGEAQPEIYLPSGTLFEGVLLNGMDAPTASNSAREPYPVTIRVTSLAHLPNKFTTNVRECFVGGGGYGRLDSERVHIRTETLSCILTDGGVIDVTIEGYITGEDGKVGMRGVVVEKTGQLLARAALAGLGSGFSDALQPRQIRSVRTGANAGEIAFDAPDTGEVLEIGAYSGAATAMEKLSDFYLERAEQIYPIIEIDALRKVAIHLTTGISLRVRTDVTQGQLAGNGSVR